MPVFRAKSALLTVSRCAANTSRKLSMSPQRMQSSNASMTTSGPFKSSLLKGSCSLKDFLPDSFRLVDVPFLSILPPSVQRHHDGVFPFKNINPRPVLPSQLDQPVKSLAIPIKWPTDNKSSLAVIIVRLFASNPDNQPSNSNVFKIRSRFTYPSVPQTAHNVKPFLPQSPFKYQKTGLIRRPISKTSVRFCDLEASRNGDFYGLPSPELVRDSSNGWINPGLKTTAI